MNSMKTVKKERKYFIDWLRIALIISVFFFHVGMIFRPEQWHVNSEETFAWLDPIMQWLHIWRMPLLFLVSGVGTYYALGFRTTRKYVKERITRLFLPLLIGFFTLVPVMIYFEKIELYTSLWDYYPHMFEGGPYPEGNISWHHMWFIVYLLVISLIIAPVIRYTRSNHFNRVRVKIINFVSGRMGMNWTLPILVLSQVILRPYFPRSTHALFNDWAFFTYYFIFFLIGFILITSNQVIQSVLRDRRLYLVQTIVFTILLFSLSSIFEVFNYAHYYTRSLVEMIISLSCGFAALGYFKKYFNKDHKARKVMNEAIYPFYLLHQPALIIVGYYVLQWDISSGMKAFVIILISLLACVGLYWFVIRRFNFLRIAFGLKLKPKKKIVMETKEVKLAMDK